MFKVMLVDDEPLALAGIRNMIDWDALGMTICASCTIAEEALEIGSRLLPDAVFTDLRMPEMDGMQLYHELCLRNVNPELVIVSAYSDFDVARAAIDCGAVGYLLKPLSETEVERVAHRLSDRLQSRNSRPSPFSLTDQDTLFQVKQELKQMNLPSQLRVLLGEADAIRPLWPGVTTVPLSIADRACAVTLCAADSPAIPPSLRALPYSLSGTIDSLRDMLCQAFAAADGCFRYSDQPTAAQMQFYIASHCTASLSLNTISCHFYLSQTYLSNFFKKHTGTTVIAFINHVRIHKACRLLDNGGMKIKEISRRVGFNDYGYFNRQFHQILGCSPEQYNAEK